MPTPAETYRAQLIRHLQNRNAERARQVADLQEENARDSAIMARVSELLPEPTLCMQCWYLHGVRSHMRTVDSRPGDPPDTARLGCPNCDLGWTVPQ